MRRSLGMLLVLVGLACILFAAYPWLYMQYLQLTDRRPFHYYFIDGNAKATLVAIAAIGIALIGTGSWMFSNRHTEK